MADSLRDEDYGILIFLSSVLIFILVGALFKSIFGRMKEAFENYCLLLFFKSFDFRVK